MNNDATGSIGRIKPPPSRQCHDRDIAAPSFAPAPLRFGSHSASVLALVATVLLSPCAGAQTIFQVNSTADGVDANTADGKCETATLTCTLRAAVMQANHMTNLGATIKLPAGTYLLGTPVDTDDDASGDLNLLIPAGTVPGPTSIIGQGSATTIIDGHGTDRVFNIDPNRTVSISAVSIINGLVAAGDGGGILNSGGNLALSDCVIANNSALGTKANGHGGGVASGGPLTVNRCTFDSNHSSKEAGGIYSSANLTINQSVVSANSSGFAGGISNVGLLFATQVSIIGNAGQSFAGGMSISGSSASLDRCEVIGNTTTGRGAGILNLSTMLDIRQTTISGNSTTGTSSAFNSSGAGIANDGTLFMSNSTVAQNTSTGNGGGIQSTGTANIYNSTIAYNEADSDADDVGDGAGVIVDAGSFNVRNSVLAGNYISGQPIYHDCIGVLGVYGNNTFSATPGCSAAPGSLGTAMYIGSLDELGILKDNGGPTQTIALVPPSAMIGGAVQCLDQNAIALATDQRGVQRPAGTSCDIGAFEYNEVFRTGFEAAQ